MRYAARKNVLMLATIGFTAMVTGLSLQVHLFGHDQGKTHDSDNCSICVMLHTSAGKYTAEQQFDIPDLSQFQGDTALPPDVRISVFNHQPFTPRAPPL